MRIKAFFRCSCGKIHAGRFVTVTSVCVCGRNLWVQLWG